MDTFPDQWYCYGRHGEIKFILQNQGWLARKSNHHSFTGLTLVVWQQTLYSSYLNLSCTFCLMSMSISEVISLSKYSDNCSVACSKSLWLSYNNRGDDATQSSISGKTCTQKICVHKYLVSVL